MKKANCIVVIVALSIILSVPLASTAGSWKPAKPIKLIVPWGAGGSTDQVTRVCAGELEGKKVRISFDEFEVPDDTSELEDKFERKAYQSCFQSLKKSAGPYLNPLHELE